MALKRTITVTAKALGVKGAVGDVRNLGGAIDKAKLAAVGFTAAAAATAAAVAKIGVEATKLASDFEFQFAQIRTLTDQANADMERQLLDLAKRVPQTAGDITKSAYQAISAGIDPKEVVTFLESASKTAVAGASTMTSAVDLLTTAVNAYEAQGLTAAEASDKLFATVRVAKTTIPELTSALGRAAPAAAAFGVTMDELGAAVSVLTKSGLSTDEAMTILNGTIKAVVKPTKEARDKMDELGISYGASRVQAVGFSGVLKDILEKTGGNIDVVSTLFRRYEATQGLVTLLSQDMKVFNEDLKAVAGSTGETARANAIMFDTFKTTLDLIGAQGEQLLRDLGNDLLPTVTEAARGLVRVMEEDGPSIIRLLSEITQAMLAVAGAAVDMTATIARALTGLEDYAGHVASLARGAEDARTPVQILFDEFENAKFAAVNVDGLRESMEDLAPAAREVAEFLGLARKPIIVPMEPVIEQAVSANAARKPSGRRGPSLMDEFESADFRSPAERLGIESTGDPVGGAAVDQMRDQFAGFDASLAALPSSTDAIAASAREAAAAYEAMVPAMQAAAHASEGMDSIMSTTRDTFVQAAAANILYGGSAEQVANAVLQQVAMEATVLAIKSTMLGMMELAAYIASYGVDGAKLTAATTYFAAAAVAGTIGAVAAAGASATGGMGPGGGGGGSRGAGAGSLDRDDLARDRESSSGPTEITINANFNGQPMHTRTDIQDSIVRAVEAAGQRRGAPRISMGRVGR